MKKLSSGNYWQKTASRKKKEEKKASRWTEMKNACKKFDLPMSSFFPTLGACTSNGKYIQWKFLK